MDASSVNISRRRSSSSFCVQNPQLLALCFPTFTVVSALKLVEQS
jgi:hypothetical protein